MKNTLNQIVKSLLVECYQVEWRLDFFTFTLSGHSCLLHIVVFGYSASGQSVKLLLVRACSRRIYIYIRVYSYI